MPERVGVVVPTRNRPEDLGRCLRALARASRQLAFTAWVCDSSDAARAEQVRELCASLEFVVLTPHDRQGIGAARNFGVEIADAELLVSVDDDVEVEPQAIAALVEAYDAASGPRVVGGAVSWGDGDWRTAPMVLRPIGYGRLARPGEAPDFLNSAFLLYPRAFARTWPWHEGLRRGSDVFMGAMWRAAGVKLVGAPEARATHAPGRAVVQEPRHQDDFVYVLLAHALVAARRPLCALSFEALGFAAGLKAFRRDPDAVATFVRAWIRGNRAFLRDRRRLAELASRPLPAT